MESRSRGTPDEGSRPIVRTPSSPWEPAPASSELVHPGSRDRYRLLCEDAIPIVNEEAVGMIARQRFPELLHCPFRRGMGREVVVENPAGSHLHDDKDVEGTERGGDHQDATLHPGQTDLSSAPTCRASDTRSISRFDIIGSGKAKERLLDTQ